MRMKRPIVVHVFWDDAADSSETCDWDGTFETAQKIAGLVMPYTNRETVGFLGYVDDKWLYLASDWDAPTSQLGKWGVIPVGWITVIRTGNGRTIYVKETKNAETMGRKGTRGMSPARSMRRDQETRRRPLHEVPDQEPV